jgi:signal transduction histidine kinase
MSLAYALLKTGFLRVAVVLCILVTALVPLVGPFVPDPHAEIGTLAAAVIPVILTAVAFSNRAAIGVLIGVAIVGSVNVMLAEMPAARTATAVEILATILVTGMLVLVFRSHMAGLERDRLSQIMQSQEEMRRLEQQLQQAVKMESIGRLAGGVAHDFNNMLAVILGNTELTMRMVQAEGQAHGRLRQVHAAAESAAALTRQLLAFSRKQVLSPCDVVVEDLVGKLRNMLLRLIGEDVQLETGSDGQRGTVQVDPGLLERVIVNLAVNARDAMPTGGRLAIETANCMVDKGYAAQHPGVKPGDYVVLTVSDTGSGMTDEVKAHLFEPFFTTKPADKGTGLGLATTYGAVQQSNGQIEVYSQVGQGTSFRIYFPRVSTSTQTAHKRVPGESLRLGAGTVLVVEDTPLVLELTARMLSHLGYTVLEADGPMAALEIARKHPEEIDLLLTDLVMPGSSGLQLASVFGEIHPETRVLYTSGYSDDVIANYGGCDASLHFISKPFSMQALSDKVRSILDLPNRS